MPIKAHIREAVLSVKRTIDKDPFKTHSIDSLLIDGRIGRNDLQKGFRAICHVSIKEYMLQQRMAKAKELLDDGKFSIKEVAHRCRYKSQSNFSSAFKKIYKMSPKEYKNEIVLCNSDE